MEPKTQILGTLFMFLYNYEKRIIVAIILLGAGTSLLLFIPALLDNFEKNAQFNLVTETITDSSRNVESARTSLRNLEIELDSATDAGERVATKEEREQTENAINEVKNALNLIEDIQQTIGGSVQTMKEAGVE